MAITDIITLGIGPDSDIQTFLVFGLGSFVPAFDTPVLKTSLTICHNRANDLAIQSDQTGTITIKRTMPGKAGYHGG